MKKPIPNGRRKFLYSLGALSLGGLALAYRTLSQHTANARVKPTPKPNARLGINISGIAYWSSEYPFVNLMHQSSEWISQPASGEWGKGPELALDQHGWVKQLANGCKATKILCAGEGNLYPSGHYVILYDGEGEIKPHQSTISIIKSDAGRLVVDVDATQGTFSIDLVSTNPQNYIRNIRVVMPGFESVYLDNPWHPDFLARWSGIACIRLMDMMQTNNSNQVAWRERPMVGDASYAEKGVPVELLIGLANRLKTDAWFCIPHQANDSYIKQLATIVNHSLKPNLKAWVEYSNEVWNGSFEQYAYAAKQGQQHKLADNEWECAYRYYAQRTVEMFNIWQRVFVDRQRFVKVIASQAANIYLSEQILKLPKVAKTADVLAIAPYVSMNVPIEADENGLSVKKIMQWNLNHLFNYVNTVALPASKQWIIDNKKAADHYGLKLVSYEAGQHLVGVNGAENDEQLTQLLMKANADVRMGKIYRKHLQDWLVAGGDLICMYNSTGEWSKWGSWGLSQHINDKVIDSPKLKTVLDWAKARGQKVTYKDK